MRGTDIVLPESGATPEIGMAEVVRRHEGSLTADQITSLPYIAYGVSLDRISEILGVKKEELKKWMASPEYKAALSDMRVALLGWHADMLDATAVLAWDVVWEILKTDYDPEDKDGRRLQAQMARFVIDNLGLKTRKVEVKHDVGDMPQLNVTEDTAELIARKLWELENSVVEGEVTEVEDEYDLSKIGLLACHPETAYGELNDRGGLLQCHVCGGWYRNLGVHVQMAHGMAEEEYKAIYKLDRGTKLISMSVPLGDEADEESTD